MPAKKETKAEAKPKAAAAPAHASYRDMIHDAIVALKERNGSSRSALKKYVVANNKSVGTGASFDAQFNRGIKSGVEKGIFVQPKGPSGTVKLAKKETPASKPAAGTKKPAAAKKVVKTAAPKEKVAAPKKTTTTKTKVPAVKKEKAPKEKKPAVAKPKANTSTKRKSKTPATAPAIVDTKTVLGKTKSGRVTKGPAKPTTAATKKTKAAPKEKKAKATPKKKDAAAAAAPAASAEPAK